MQHRATLRLRVSATKPKGNDMICQQFALCENEATTTRPGAQIIDGKLQIVEVPTCDRCAEKVDRINAMN